MVETLRLAWSQFSQMRLIDQMLAIFTFFGIPSIGGFLLGLTRIGKLRKANKGLRSALQIAEAEKRAMEAQSGSEALKSYYAGSLDITDLENALTHNMSAVAVAHQEICRHYLDQYYERREKSLLTRAAHAAEIASTVGDNNLISGLLIDEIRMCKSGTLWKYRSKPFEELIDVDWSVLCNSILSDVKQLLMEFKDKEAVRLSRHLMNGVLRAHQLRSENGELALYTYVKAMIFRYDRFPIPPKELNDLRSSASLLVELNHARATESDISWHVAEWHYYSVERISGNGDVVIEFIEKSSVLKRMERMFGPKSNLLDCWWDLYARTAAEFIDPLVADGIVNEYEAYLVQRSTRSENMEPIVPALRALITSRKNDTGQPSRLWSVKTGKHSQVIYQYGG